MRFAQQFKQGKKSERSVGGKKQPLNPRRKGGGCGKSNSSEFRNKLICAKCEYRSTNMELLGRMCHGQYNETC
jgi:hypothetical protein